jgi:heptose-I-phosphate ethanolaminephosphotransferase
MSIKSALSKILYVIFVFSISIESAYFYIFDTFFSASAIFIILETNYAEASEFLFNYVSPEIILLLFIDLVFIIAFIIKSYVPVLVTLPSFKTKYKYLFLTLIFFLLTYSGLYFANFPYQFIKGGTEYLIEIKKYEKFNIKSSFGNFKNVEFKGNSNSHTFVLIIGESTTRHHLGIYDFYRSTTPKLSQIKDDLLIYKDVISSESHTIESLQAALSLDNFKKETESTLIQLMNQAGFKTFWLSNQIPIGIYDTLLSKVAKASDSYVFTNTTDYGSKTPYDEVLLPHLDNALNDDFPNKFIVLHLLATHGRYKLRYPDKFDIFKDIPKTRFPKKANLEIINTYHNSISYVDYLVDQVIKKVSSQNQNSFVVYFSDHGEEVFTDRDFFGHNDLEEPTRFMFEIPFVVWLSPQYKSNYTIDFKPENPFSIEHLLHSISDLSKIDFNEKELEKSIFSKYFKPSIRIISGRLDYDDYFKSKIDSLH